jgi:hypothetical protein
VKLLPFRFEPAKIAFETRPNVCAKLARTHHPPTGEGGSAHTRDARSLFGFEVATIEEKILHEHGTAVRCAGPRAVDDDSEVF